LPANFQTPPLTPSRAPHVARQLAPHLIAPPINMLVTLHSFASVSISLCNQDLRAPSLRIRLLAYPFILDTFPNSRKVNPNRSFNSTPHPRCSIRIQAPRPFAQVTFPSAQEALNFSPLPVIPFAQLTAAKALAYLPRKNQPST